MYSFAIVNALLTFVFKYSRRKSCSGIINPSKPNDCFVYHLFLHSRFSVLPTDGISVFCMRLRVNSDYLLTDTYLVRLYNRGAVC
jgi:hypothetical protein